MKATITSKGQVTIPKPVRDHLHLKEKDRIDFKISDDGKVLLEKPASKIADAGGMLAAYKSSGSLTLDQMNAIVREEVVKRNKP